MIVLNKFSREGKQVKGKDIARAAGVSTSAVSLVLNDKPCRLSDKHQGAHILRAAREMRFEKEQNSNIQDVEAEETPRNYYFTPVLVERGSV